MILTLSLNFGFVLGAPGIPGHHGFALLLTSILANVTAVGFKLQDRTEIGNLLIVCGLVASAELIMAAVVGFHELYTRGTALTNESSLTIASLASGAFIANLVAVTGFVINTLKEQYTKR